MCVCICVYMCVCALDDCRHIVECCGFLCSVCVCVCVYLYVRVCVYVSLQYMYVRVCVYVSVCSCALSAPFCPLYTHACLHHKHTLKNKLAHIHTYMQIVYT